MKQVREGYKMTELGEIPVEWEVINFKNVCKVVSGLVNPNEEPYNYYPHIGNANIEKETGKLLGFNYAFEDNLISGKYLFNSNHVLYGKINPQFAKVAFPKFEGLCSADMYPIECNELLLKPIFLKYMMLDLRFTKQMTAASARTGIPKVNRKELEEYNFILPPINEQQKIDEILSTVNEQIENIEQLIEKTKELKKGLMQQLLTKGIGHTEFKHTELGEIPVEWEIRLFNDICSRIIVGIASSTSEHYTSKDNGVIIVRNQNIKANYLDIEDVLYISKEFDLSNKKKRLCEGDLLTVRTGYPGVTCVVPSELENAQSFTTLISSLYREKAEPNYMAYFMNSPLGKNQLVQLSAGGAQQNLNVSSLSVYKVIVPPLEEQQKIAEILSSVDEQIESYEQEKEKYLQLKKGLMQQLLTGKMRVTV